MRRASVTGALAVTLAASASGQAPGGVTQRQAAGSDSSPPPRRVSMTVSGGVSLGSYQAGATWAFIYVLKNYDTFAKAWPRLSSRDASLAPPRQYVLDVLTGASAGNVNAVIAALEYCASEPPRAPEGSLFWHAWTPIGFRELTAGRVTDTEPAVFSREAFRGIWSAVDGRLTNPGRTPDCDLLLGITTTKLAPHKLHIAEGMYVPIQRFAGVFRLIADSVGLTFTLPRRSDVLLPELTDILILDPAMRPSAGRRPRLVRGDVVLDVKRVQELVEASGSFPMAFAPRDVSFQLLDALNWWDDQRPSAPCVLLESSSDECAEPVTDRFIDGGLFDNRPLGLAFDLSRATEGAGRRPQDEARGRAALGAAIDFSSRRCEGTDSAIVAARRQSATLRTLTERLAQIETALQLDTARSKSDSPSVLSVDSLAHLKANRAVIDAHLVSEIGVLDRLERDMDESSDAQRACAAAAARVVAVNDSLKRAASVRLPDRVIYFIDDDARRTRRPDSWAAPVPQGRPVGSAPAGEPFAGVAAGLRILSQAFHTGQNSELRLFANRFRHEGIEGRRYSLGMNTRFPRLMADHIGHFGAFLARTFREHDFYAGVYDGLRSSFGRLYCPEQGRQACEVAWLRLVLDSPDLLTLQPSGKALVRRLLAYEEGPGRPPLALPDTADQRTRALVTLAHANVTAYENGRECEAKAFLIETPLCSDRLLNVVADWRGHLESLGPGGTDVLCNGPQRDWEACQLVRDTRAVYHGMTLRVLARLWRAEVILNRQREGYGYPGSVGLPLFAERAYNEQFRSCRQPKNLPCVDANPTTSDVLGGRWHAGAAHLLPVTVAGMRDGSAHWAEWRPTVYLLRIASRYSVAATAPIQGVRRHGHWRGAAGAGVTVMPPWAFLSAISFSKIYERPDESTTELTTALLAGVVRIGFRHERPYLQRLLSSGSLSLGVGDANGMSSRFVAWSASESRRKAKKGGAWVKRQVERLW